MVYHPPHVQHGAAIYGKRQT